MNEDDLIRLETTLGLTLPFSYRTVVRQVADELGDWPPLLGETKNRPLQDFLLDVDELIQVQEDARRRYGGPLPSKSFVFGRCGIDFWLIDTSEWNWEPAVQRLYPQGLGNGPKSFAEMVRELKARQQDAWDAATRRAKVPTSSLMTADKLLAEARQMARPAALLVPDGVDCAAIWEGPGIVPSPAGEWQHWLSIDARFLPANPGKRTGVISVYLCMEDGERFFEVAAVHDPTASLPAHTNGRRLYAIPMESLPALEVLFKLGSPAIRQWLQANGIDPENPTSYNRERLGAPCLDIINAYEELIASQHPVFGNVDCFAMLGGWSIAYLSPTSSDSWDDIGKALTVVTIQGSEPWIEVFDDGQTFEGYSRIT